MLWCLTPRRLTLILLHRNWVGGTKSLCKVGRKYVRKSAQISVFMAAYSVFLSLHFHVLSHSCLQRFSSFLRHPAVLIAPCSSALGGQGSTAVLCTPCSRPVHSSGARSSLSVYFMWFFMWCWDEWACCFLSLALYFAGSLCLQRVLGWHCLMCRCSSCCVIPE